MAVPQASSSKLLQEMMDDGTFDDLRQRLVTQLKDHEELRAHTAESLNNSETVKSLADTTKPRKELFESLRREVEGSVLSKASTAVWELLQSDEGIGKEIEEKVDAAMARMEQTDRA